MKTEYAILRDGSKIPMSNLYLDTELPRRKYPLRCTSDSNRFWTRLGHYEIDEVEHGYDILNIDDVLKGLNTEDPLAKYRTPQAMADTHAAYARGEKIEFTYNSPPLVFDVIDVPSFNWGSKTYRPAPKWEPKIGEVVLAKLTNWRSYQLCFLAYWDESQLHHQVWLDPERSEIFYATGIKPFTQDK